MMAMATSRESLRRGRRSIALASAATAECRSAALAEGIVSTFQAATEPHAPSTMVIVALRESLWRGHYSY
jgi:hypothetical protein